MVTTRTTGSFAQLSRSKFNEIVSKVGRTDFLLTHNTTTQNAMGRILTHSESTEIISGDLQFVTVQDNQILDLGIAKIGDAIFYTSASNTVNAFDELTIDGVTWELEQQVEGEQINGLTSYQAWLAKRKDA